MEYLWKKDENTSNDEFIDIFQFTRKNYGNDFNYWDDYICSFSEWLVNSKAHKNDNIAHELLCKGQTRFRLDMYQEALENYNRSLCYAAVGSKCEADAYESRSTCFMKMGKYTNALIDIELALKSKIIFNSDQIRLRSLRVQCLNQLQLKSSSGLSAPKLSFTADYDFPCMANVLEIRENKEYGRHIVAKCAIDVNKIVMVSDVFASASVTEKQTNCCCCNKIERNLIACTHCPNVMFCVGSCASRNNVHSLECGSIFQLIGHTQMKLPVQTVLMAIAMFSTVDELMDFVCESIENQQLPKKVKNTKSRYALFLNLVQSHNRETLYWAYQLFTTLMAIERVNMLFDTDKKRKLLMHLTIQHLNILPKNAFQHETYGFGFVQTEYVYDVLSLINHSCSPNVYNHSTPDDIAYCMTIRKIKKGEQIFINYLGNDSEKSRPERHDALKKTWDFHCKCKKCESDKIVELNVKRNESPAINMKNDVVANMKNAE